MADGAELTAALAKKMGGFEALGQRAGVTGRAIQNYVERKRVPRAKVRQALASLPGGPPESSWDPAGTPRSSAPQMDVGAPAMERETAKPPQPTRTLAPRVAATAPTREQQEALVRDLDAMLVDALGDATASYRDRASVAAAKNAALRTLASMRGETQVTETQVLRSPSGQRVLGVLFAALRGYPEACAAAADALERLEASAGTETAP